MSWFRLKACPKCRGDLASDEGDWICLQCGTYYYTGLYSANRPRSGPEAGSPRNGQLTSQTDQRDQAVQGRGNEPDYPSPSEEKALVWRLGVPPAVVLAAPRVAAVTVNLTPSVDLAIRQQ